MPKNLYYLLFFVIILLFSNCSPTLELQAVEVVPTVKVTNIEVVAENESYRLRGKKYPLTQ